MRKKINTLHPIYLDYNATTPVDERVLAAMLPWFSVQFGNAASRSHLYGWQADEAVELARQHTAALIGADAKEIVFTSGATESNNLAIKGVFEASLLANKHIITVQTEHRAVLDVCENLARRGAMVTYLKPATDGLVSPQQVSDALRPETILVSVMQAHNEIGVLQPIGQIAQVAHQHGVLFHSDATQAVGKIPVNVAADGVDLLSFSAHKLYGPKGVGALYVRRQKTPVLLTGQMDGGRHERGLRAGTLNVPGIVGLGEACRLAKLELDNNALLMGSLRDTLENTILEKIAGSFVNGSRTHRLPNVTNIAFPNIDGEQLLLNLHRIAVSSGSACTSASVLPSYVLKALGLSDAQAQASVRFSLGKYTTPTDVAMAAAHVVEIVQKMENQ